MSASSEIAKLPAFLRRDLRITLSYRTAAIGGLLAIVAQALVFSFIGKLVDPSRLPTFGGARTTYMEFVTIGIAFSMVVALMLHQVAMAIRTEQMIGTLESLLVTPTRVITMQAGSAAFELVYVPLRIGLFVALIGLLFGLNFHASGIVPSIVILVGFVPFVWGLGLMSAAAILTFRRGGRRGDRRRVRSRADFGCVLSARAAPGVAADDRQGQPARDRDQRRASVADRRTRLDVGG